jgi:hypothetical protein
VHRFSKLGKRRYWGSSWQIVDAHSKRYSGEL